jgi:hypothetical protein
VPKNPPLQAFPTTFPADAAAKIGQAILSRSFGKDLIEPIYDLVGYGLGLILGSNAPFPKPAMATTYGDDEVTYQQVGYILTGAANAHQADVEPSAFDRARVAAGLVSQGQADAQRMTQAVEGLPWGTILQVLWTILQAIRASEQPAPAE